jgi:hypothetical protein
MSLRTAAILSFVLTAAIAATGCDLIKKAAAGKKFGEPCTSAMDCDGFPQASCNTARGGICSKTCAGDSDCGGTLVCASDPTGTGASCAVKVAGLAAVGGACSNDAAECDHGPCLHKGDDPAGFCSQRCKTSADCPAGFKICTNINDLGAQKVCLPGADATSTPPPVGVANKKPAAAPGGGAAAAPGGGAVAAPAKAPPPPPPAKTPPAKPKH